MALRGAASGDSPPTGTFGGLDRATGVGPANSDVAMAGAVLDLGTCGGRTVADVGGGTLASEVVVDDAIRPTGEPQSVQNF
jgi:hypothetical protein